MQRMGTEVGLSRGARIASTQAPGRRAERGPDDFLQNLLGRTKSGVESEPLLSKLLIAWLNTRVINAFEKSIDCTLSPALSNGVLYFSIYLRVQKMFRS